MNSSTTGSAERQGGDSPERPAPDAEDELVTELLARFALGDVQAREDLFRVVAAELHSIARREMRKQPPGHTLQATALMNEAYIKLFGREPTACKDKQHLLRAAARAMHQVLKDHARAKLTRKRADAGRRVELGTAHAQVCAGSTASFLEFSDEVQRLSRVSSDMARAMEMRFILGFQNQEIAEALGIPMRSFERDFASAMTFLAVRLR